MLFFDARALDPDIERNGLVQLLITFARAEGTLIFSDLPHALNHLSLPNSPPL